MRVAFLYIAEAYQCYHTASVAFELACRPGVSVDILYNDPTTPRHIERIRAALGAPALPVEPLRRGLVTRALQSLRVLGMMKTPAMRDDRRRLNEYDVIVATENSVAATRDLGIDRPRLVFIPHGPGDRARGFIPRISRFDLVLPAGPKTVSRMLEMGLIKPGHYASPGYPKLETAAALARAEGPLFPNARPIVLYNAHKAPGLESWSRFIEPMLAGFAASDGMNLIVAPHIKMFRRKGEAVRRRWEARSTSNVLIDTASDRLLDMSYSSAADIYVGDVSSQVYEFLATPRPCVFLNAHKVQWRDDPSYLHWTLGDVVDDPAELMAALRAAPGRHPLYRDRQEELAAASLGDRSPGAARRAADAILTFMAAGRV